MSKFVKGRKFADPIEGGHERMGSLTFVFRNCTAKITENGNVELKFPVTLDNAIPIALAEIMRGNDYSENEIMEVLEAFHNVNDRSVLRFHTVEKYRGG